MQTRCFLALVWLTAAGCFDHPSRPGDPTPDAAAPVVDAALPAIDSAVPTPDGQLPDAAPTDGPSVDATVLTTTAMVAAACTGGTCTPSKIIGYWRNEWDRYAVKRTVRFQDVSANEHHLVVTDELGMPATLDFMPGIPVTLTVLNPGDSSSTGKHNLTGPELFRAVAWRRVRTADGEFRATHFDAVHVRRRSGADLSAVLEFVPINPGSFDLYCQIGVPNGNAYEAIVAGAVDPDLASTAGHAGKGAKLGAVVRAGLGVSIAQPVAALGADPRRPETHAVWANGARNEIYRSNPVRLYEFTDEEYAFLPANLTMTANVGYVVRVANPAENLRAHVFSASGFLTDSVIRKAQDADIEVESSTLTSIQLLVNSWMELFVVPTRGAMYGSYCDVGVQLNPDGTPKLTTGHAARGMVGSLMVSP